MDELHSWLLVTDPDVGHAMSALADGADYNPPTYYLVARTISVFGPITEFRLRLLSLAFVIGAATAVYLMLSRRFTVAASAGATLFALSHQLIVLQSTETRFYALWICLLMWFCWLLTKDTHSMIHRCIQVIALAVLSIAICTTHYFGVISVGIVTAAWCFSHRYSGRSLMVCGTLLCCCIGAIACCLPMLQSQKAALTCPTWVKPPTFISSAEYICQFVPLFPLGLCAAAAFFGWVSRQQPVHADEPPPEEATVPPATWSTDNTMLLALLLMPLTLIVFSWTIQPALVNRYATVAVFAMAGLHVWLLSRTTEAIQNTCVGIAAFMVVFAIHNGSETWRFHLEKQFELQERLTDLPPDTVVVFEDRIDFWLLQHLQNSEDREWYQADFESDDLRRPSNLRIVQRDVGRRTAKWFPNVFRMKSMRELSELPEFVVVPYIDKPFGELRFPDSHAVERLSGRLFRLSRKPDAESVTAAPTTERH